MIILLDIILKMYTYDSFKIKLCMVAPAAPLPKWFCDFIDDYFRQKTELKKEVEQLIASGTDQDTIFNAENDLEKIKNMFNYLLHIISYALSNTHSNASA